ncbi:MAG: SDR family oxidoreductase [Acidobacteriota bacterium]|nr:SDR family oxidoreductase [Acidobacteriota bacterium]
MENTLSERLSGQTAVVTGASSGIGQSVAMALARAGANVVINYGTRREPAEQMAVDLTKEGRQAMTFQADVSREDQVARMFQAAIARFGTVHILVNNAGIQKDSPVVSMSLADWQKVIDINLTGQFLCAREAAREFLRRGVQPEISSAAGKIICISSVHEIIPWANHANYAASKGGVLLLMKTLAQELAPHKIRVNSIAPGAVKTAINRSAWSTPEGREGMMKLIPYGRLGEPGDIAAAAVWLAGDDSDYVNGTTIFVDGGMTLYPGFTSGG